MFREAWRLERDYFYDRGMHGVDWPAVYARYEPLVDRVTDRAELGDLLAQMVAELRALHTFVYGGDQRWGDEWVDPASLGADLQRDEASGGFRVTRVWPSDPDRPALRSPLATFGQEVREGEVLTAIDGVSLRGVADPGSLLRGKAGSPGAAARGRRRRQAAQARPRAGRGGGAAVVGRRVGAPVPRVGARAAAPGRGGDRRPPRVRAPARDGRRGHRPVDARDLAAVRPRRPDRRRPQQRRRQHRQLDPRAPAPQGLDVLEPARRGLPVVEHAAGVPGPRGRAGRPPHGLGR
jgi:hypothetical protein